MRKKKEHKEIRFLIFFISLFLSFIPSLIPSLFAFFHYFFLPPISSFLPFSSCSLFLFSFFLSVLPSLFPSLFFHLSIFPLLFLPSLLPFFLSFLLSFFPPFSLSVFPISFFPSLVIDSHLSVFLPCSSFPSSFLPFKAHHQELCCGHPSWAWVRGCPWSHTQAHTATSSGVSSCFQCGPIW